jgi:CheY-like chemotaxis protein/HPt (histidine-containing phosphotransfer) domain-containing protein
LEHPASAKVVPDKKQLFNRHPLPTKSRILLAEDNQINQRVMLATLAHMGLKDVKVANNGQEVLTALEKRRYDLILMDVSMPVMDGFTATQAIRGNTKLHPQTPIIALTAHAIAGDRERCLAAGMDDYIAKPVDQRELAQLLQKYLPAAPAEEETASPSAALPTLPSPLPSAQPEEKLAARPAAPPPNRPAAPTTPPIARAGKEAMAAHDALAKDPGSGIDMAALLTRVGQDRELAHSILTELKDDLPLQMMLLHSQVKSGDTDGAARQAQKIRGAVGNIGAAQACRLLLEIEALGHKNDTSGQRQAYQRLQLQTDALLAGITTLLRRKTEDRGRRKEDREK